ncbi:hypothetical protein IW261DRAFT_1428648 [Armillaria novae-zelandiae]|uniref:Uncharacterized protein n=1 Tax=Armillaria novae-zelandiae TaxID=153914 RepID=A0AA39N8B2_9AGAR|nr:hypothetical protein IW261DRAFT_1428648 [Armillaria novae-zelandiae]
MKAMRKYGKTERKIIKTHWTPSQSNVKERDGCCQYVCLHTFFFLDTRLERPKDSVWADAMGNLFIQGTALSVVLYEEFDKDKGNKIHWCSEGRRSKDGKMQVKHQEYTCGNKGRMQCMPASLSTLFADTNLIQSMPQGMGTCTVLLL